MSDNANDGLRNQHSSSNPKQPGKTMADLLFLPETERSLMNWLLRQQAASVTEVAAHLEQNELIAQTVLDQLAAQGFVQCVESDGQQRYQPCLTSRRGRQVPSSIWNALES
jgi:predicted transcriptional regulator